MMIDKIVELIVLLAEGLLGRRLQVRERQQIPATFDSAAGGIIQKVIATLVAITGLSAEVVQKRSGASDDTRRLMEELASIAGSKGKGARDRDQ